MPTTMPGLSVTEAQQLLGSMDRTLRLFTAKQKARWRELVGEPFPGVLPPANLVLSFGKMTMTFGPGGASRDPKKGGAERPPANKPAKPTP